MRLAIGKEGAEGIPKKIPSSGIVQVAGCCGEDKKSCLKLQQEMRLKKPVRARLPKALQGDQGC